jgi:aconitate decarboxylase
VTVTVEAASIPPAPLAAERLAAHVVDTGFAQLPADAIVKAKTFILDTFGVGVAGSRAPFAAELKAQVGRWGAGEEARAWGDRLHLPAGSAALVNGFQIHSQEYDCVHEPAVVHALTVPQGRHWHLPSGQGECRDAT